jgi:hypothetical protein
MFQYVKLVLFTGMITAASFSQPGGLGYGTAIEMATAGLQAMARLVARWRRRSGRGGDRGDLRRMRGHPAHHAA